MKKFVLSLGALIMTISLVACGNGSSAKKSSESSPFTMSKVDSKGILTAKAYDVDEDGGYYSLSGKAEPGETVVLLVSYDDYTEKNPTATEEARTNADKKGNWKIDDFLVVSTKEKSEKYEIAAVTTDKKVVDVSKKNRGDKDFSINKLSRKIKFLAPTFKDTSKDGDSSVDSSSESDSDTEASSSSSIVKESSSSNSSKSKEDAAGDKIAEGINQDIMTNPDYGTMKFNWDSSDKTFHATMDKNSTLYTSMSDGQVSLWNSFVRDVQAESKVLYEKADMTAGFQVLNPNDTSRTYLQVQAGDIKYNIGDDL